MIPEATDFLEESRSLHALVASLPPADYRRPTQFKDWTIDDVLQHLHFFNIAADRALASEAEFDQLYGALWAKRNAGASLVEATDRMLQGLRGRPLLDAWQETFEALAERYRNADPKQRVKWAGPRMSARSSISARLMETWAHGQAIFDLLDVIRHNTDRIRSVAVLGVNTYGWTFLNRGEPVPEPTPHVRLVAPSGAVWTWNEPSETDRIEGSAEQFCQVVTQVRNIADTELSVCGDSARRWMAIAQCFAGAPNLPPAPGTRGPRHAPAHASTSPSAVEG